MNDGKNGKKAFFSDILHSIRTIREVGCLLPGIRRIREAGCPLPGIRAVRGAGCPPFNRRMSGGAWHPLLMAGIFVVSSLLGSMAWLVSCRMNERLFYDKMAAIAVAFSGEEEKLMQALKDPERFDAEAGRKALVRYGYEGRLPAKEQTPAFFASGFLAAGLTSGAFFLYIRRENNRIRRRTEELTDYLRQVEEGKDTLSLERKQDVFSGLEDEIYKTVLALRESRENLRQEKERLADNLADISHQFRTPLTSLTVLGELLLRHVEGTGDAVLVRQMESQTERLTDLTFALLTLSRADAGVLSFEIRQVPVRELIECSLESVLPLMEKKGQQARVLGEEVVLENLFLPCDLGWTREALGNLLKNACEHGPEGTQISIRVWDNPVFSGIAVEDQGPGFSREELRHIFERFYTGTGRPDAEDGSRGGGKKGRGRMRDLGTDLPGGGAGLGLSLARALIENQSGELRAENRKEGGARFVIKFYKNM